MSLKGKRLLVSHDLPFLLGAYPERPAPAHVLNGFLRAAFGTGPAADGVRELIRAAEPTAVSAAVSPQIVSSLGEFSFFRTALAGVFDADRRVFPNFGSPFPIHGSVVAPDPSDEGFGRDLWSFVSRLDPTVRDKLLKTFFPTAAEDAVTAMAMALTGAPAPSAEFRPGEEDPNPWAGQTGKLGRRFAKALGVAIEGRLGENRHPRSVRIASVSKALYFALFLLSLRLGDLFLRKPDDWDDLIPMFVFGGLPPGDRKSSATRLACRSFEQVVASHRTAARSLLLSRLRSQRLPRSLPDRQRARTAVRLAFDGVAQSIRDEAEDVVGQTASVESMADRLITEVYPPGHLERGFRSMGRKIGFAGPDRGYGAPRFLLETPSVALLVEVTIDHGESRRYEDWLDDVYARFGIILGRGRRYDPLALLARLDSLGRVRAALDFNHEALRKRLIRSGLAVEYSDSETEVQRYTN
jgi:hypothetical protein